MYGFLLEFRTTTAVSLAVSTQYTNVTDTEPDTARQQLPRYVVCSRAAIKLVTSHSAPADPNLKDPHASDGDMLVIYKMSSVRHDRPTRDMSYIKRRSTMKIIFRSPFKSTWKRQSGKAEVRLYAVSFDT